MIGLDTNILIRYLTKDDVIQAKAAYDLITSDTNKKRSLFINDIVLSESIWVLETAYKYTKQQISETLSVILSTKEFCFEHLDSLWIALDKYTNCNVDFADALIGEVNKLHNCSVTYSFDTRASKSATGFQLLK